MVCTTHILSTRFLAILFISCLLSENLFAIQSNPEITPTTHACSQVLFNEGALSGRGAMVRAYIGSLKNRASLMRKIGRERLLQEMRPIAAWAMGLDAPGDRFDPEQADVILVHGSDSLRTVEEAAELWHAANKKGKTPRIIVMGGIGPGTRTISEHSAGNDLTDQALLPKAKELLNHWFDQLENTRRNNGMDSAMHDVEKRFNIREGLDAKKAPGPRVKFWWQFLPRYKPEDGPIERQLFVDLLNPDTRANTKVPEAIMFYAFLTAAGVPSTAVDLDAQSTSTQENILFIKEKLNALAGQNTTALKIIDVHKPILYRRTGIDFSQAIAAEGLALNLQFHFSPMVDDAFLTNLSLSQFWDIALFLLREVELAFIYFSDGVPELVETMPQDVQTAAEELMTLIVSLPYQGSNGARPLYDRYHNEYTSRHPSSLLESA